jgi:SAM-dependent methyltransferase
MIDCGGETAAVGLVSRRRNHCHSGDPVGRKALMTIYSTDNSEIDAMPRGGPTASWLNRRLQTSRPEYLDRSDVPDKVKQYVVTALDDLGTRNGTHEAIARQVVDLVAGIERPRILELGAGHGRLSEHILSLHPTAELTVSDLDPHSVGNLARGPLGRNPRVRTKVVDATSIDDPEKHYDLVVSALFFHHLPPSLAVKAIAEATRVGQTFLVVDLIRMPTPMLLLMPPVLALVIGLRVRPLAAARAVIHDGVISGLRAYSPSAFEELGGAADPRMHVEIHPEPKLRPGARCITFQRQRTG